MEGVWPYTDENIGEGLLVLHSHHLCAPCPSTLITKGLAPPVFKVPTPCMYTSSRGLGPPAPWATGISARHPLTPTLPSHHLSTARDRDREPTTPHPSSPREIPLSSRSHHSRDVKHYTLGVRLQSCWTWCRTWQPPPTPVVIQPDPHCLGLGLPQPVPRHWSAWPSSRCPRDWLLLSDFRCAQKPIPKYPNIQPEPLLNRSQWENKDLWRHSCKDSPSIIDVIQMLWSLSPLCSLS